MEKEFVPYDLALELKQLGFDEPCLASYYHAGRKLDICEYINNGEYTVLAPLYQQAFRWFRENYELEVVFSPDSLNKEELKLRQYKIISYHEKWVLEKYVDQSHWTRKGCFKTYEEAELACLQKLIEIVKTK